MKPIIIILLLLLLRKILVKDISTLNSNAEEYNMLNKKEVKQLSDEHRTLVSIFHGANPNKHSLGYLIAEKEDIDEKEIVLLKLLIGLWADYPAVVAGLKSRLNTVQAKNVIKKMNKVNDNLNPYTGGTISWEIEQPEENNIPPAED